MRESGISNDTTVVLYGDNNNWFAAYAFWLCKLYGHEDVRLMNGGRKKWLDEGRPITQAVLSHGPGSYQAKDADLSLRATHQKVEGMLDRVRSGQAALVDVRSAAEYTGEIMAPPGLPETAQRAGHIPGAANIPWAQAVKEDSTFKSADELRSLYEGKGVSADKEVVAYCRIGERSSHSWFVLKYLLGLPNVANYDGSWTEWGSMVGKPIEK
jgi:thiosulfate/3-mercaptopyruvate sulfurtransferase